MNRGLYRSRRVAVTMVSAVGVMVSVAGCASGWGVAASTQVRSGAAAYRQVVRDLTRPAMQGRGIGSDGLARARDDLVARFEAIGLEPAFTDEAGGATYLQRVAVDLDGESHVVHNVGGLIRGSGAGEVVVVGAHYDHLGWGEHRSRAEGGERGRVHPGADDNASGVAAMLLAAEAIAVPDMDTEVAVPRRSVVFVAFAGEEVGNWGSRHFVAHPDALAVDSPRVVAMVNLDMVGRLTREGLTIASLDGDRRWETLVTAANATGPGLTLRFVDWNVGVSDHVPFDRQQIPAIHLFTGRHEDYHRPSDTVEKINAEGGAKIAALTAGVVELLVVQQED